jgi:hypothetical protein
VVALQATCRWFKSTYPYHRKDIKVNSECPKCYKDNAPIEQKDGKNGTVYEYVCSDCNWKYAMKVSKC